MTRANHKAWFTSPTAKISYRSVDKWAERQQQFRPYFPTWREAHRWMVNKACADVAKAERALKAAKRHLVKVMALADPTASEEGRAP